MSMKLSLRLSVARSPKNHQIPFQTVQLQKSDGSLLPPAPLQSLLAQINKSTHLIRLTQHNPPVVRILDHLQDKTNNLARKALRKAAPKSTIATKELRLSWHTSTADFLHKVAQARKVLQRGDLRVDFLFHGSPSPSRTEMTQRMLSVADSLANVSNQWKDNAFLGRGQAKLFLQSTVRVSKQVPDRQLLQEQAKKALQKRDKSRTTTTSN